MSSVVAGGGEDRPIVVRPLGEKGQPVPGLGVFGMVVFLTSLSVLFGASLVAYGVIRLRADVWPPAGAPALPVGLWGSTAILIGCSAAVQAALSAIRRGDESGLRRFLNLTSALALLFLITQAWSWYGFFDAATFEKHLYAFTFYMLTGLHALHVIGGLVVLAVVTVFAYRRAYSWAFYPGVRHAALYWHFLGVVWLILFAVLLIDR